MTSLKNPAAQPAGGRWSRLVRGLCLSLAWLLAVAAAPAGAQVVISQVYGGGGNSGATLKNDFIELFNRGSSAVSIGGWSVQYASSAGTTWQVTAIPAGATLQPGQYFLVREAQGAGGTVDLPTPDATGTIPMSGTAGKVALVQNSTSALSGASPTTNVVDFVSYGTASTAVEGTPTANLSNTTAALRKVGGCTDANNNSADFDIGAPSPRNTATAVAPCSAPNPGPTPAEMAIYTIQGSGAASTKVGQLVATSGVVTKVLNNGFFMQDLTGDNDPLTSDGILVFTGATSYPAVAVGNLVRVVGTVAEFNTGAAANADTLAHTVTELTSVTGVTLVGTGYSIAPTLVTLPEAVNDDLERYEGMLVTLTGPNGGPLTVQQNFFQGRYGQLTLASGGRMETPTNKYRPGTAQALALANENARRRIILDDGTSLQNPSPTPYFFGNGLPRAGDSVGSITGVIDYGLATNDNTGAGDYKIHPTSTPSFSVANPRPTAPPAVGGNLRLGSFNVLNFFTTFADGNTADGQTGQGCSLGGVVAASNCRGANNATEFGRQRTKIVEAISTINADAVGLMEMQNNGNTAVNHLVAALNAKMGAGTYASVALPAATGDDAIRVAMIYKPSRLVPVGAPQGDADPINNRPPLAQTFAAANGERFTLVVNHLKSKSSCPLVGDADYAGNNDAGDGQGCWNARRVAQATRLRTWVGSLQAASGVADVLLVGDFNAYGQEDPIYNLTSNGFVDQIGRFNALGYSYVFDGASGRLDHAITSGTLSSKVSGATEWHINADESSIYDYNLEFKQPACASCEPDPYQPDMYRASDHDPVVLGLNLYKTVAGTTGRDVLVGTPGDDILIGGPGADTLSGNGGRNLFVYSSMRDAGDTVTDFAPGLDRLDLRTLLAGLGWAGTDPVAEGWVVFTASGTGTVVSIDADGRGTAQVPRPLLTLANVSPASLQSASDLVVR